jgi:hypothetical protein
MPALARLDYVFDIEPMHHSKLICWVYSIGDRSGPGI